MLYARFMISLGMGLLGVCMVLKTLFDVLLADWDVLADLRQLLGRPAPLGRSTRIELEEENLQEPVRLTTRYRLSYSP